MIEAFPLQWPTHVRRSRSRTWSQFKQTMLTAQRALDYELSLLGASQVVVSTNYGPRKRDGSLYANARLYDNDPGVAVYFVRKGQKQVIACDKYAEGWENIYAVAKTIEALRGIERWGSSQMLDQAFTGFAALPQSTVVACWWDVLGVSRDAGSDIVDQAYRALVRKHHPDVAGGDHDRMSEINSAYDSYKAERVVA